MTKYRSGFVSNSSSSSFIVINSNPSKYSLKKSFTGQTFYINGEDGETEFGWGPETISDTYSRINFAAIQALYAENEHPEFKKMLERVIRKHTGAKGVAWRISIEWSRTPEKGVKYNCYIDHQSAYTEGSNIGMFESEQTLKNFLFGEGSYIELDNDNR